VAKAAEDRANLILVAQSLAGFTAPLVWDRAALRMLVFVNAMIPRPGEHAECKQASCIDQDFSLQTKLIQYVATPVYSRGN